MCRIDGTTIETTYGSLKWPIRNGGKSNNTERKSAISPESEANWKKWPAMFEFRETILEPAMDVGLAPEAGDRVAMHRAKMLLD
jgi:hypothetical protein